MKIIEIFLSEIQSKIASFMKKLAPLLIFILPLTLCYGSDIKVSSAGSEMKFLNISKANGLSNNNILDIFEDRYGFIWIATTDGLNRYDGYNFKIFRNNPKDFTTISSNFITDIDEDEEGNLWIATDNGLNLYNREKNIFFRYFHEPDIINSISDSYIRAIHCSGNNTIWIESSDGTLNKFNIKLNIFTRYSHKAVFQYYYNYHSIFESDSGLWIGARNIGPLFFNFKTKLFHTVSVNRTDTTKKEKLMCHVIFWINRKIFGLLVWMDHIL